MDFLISITDTQHREILTKKHRKHVKHTPGKNRNVNNKTYVSKIEYKVKARITEDAIKKMQHLTYKVQSDEDRIENL